jgi:LemA protein
MAGDVKVVEEKGPKPVQFTNRMVKWIVIVAAVVAVAGWVGGTYNRLVTSRENVDKSWSSVESEYQKRADLVPNLVATVKGAANFEQTTLTQVTEARAKATQVKVDLNDPNSVQQFSAAQGELSSWF